MCGKRRQSSSYWSYSSIGPTAPSPYVSHENKKTFGTKTPGIAGDTGAKALGHRTSPLPINIIREGFYPSRASPANRSESHHASLPKTNWKLGSLEAWMLGTCTMRTLAKDLSFVFPKSKTILLPGVRYSIFKTCHLVNGLPSGNAVAHPQ